MGLRIILISIVAVIVLVAGIVLVTNGGTFLRDDEAKAACYTLVSQKYDNPIVLSYETEHTAFREITVHGHVRGQVPERVFEEVEVRYECVVNFRTGFPQARLSSLTELP
jgi:hypothetical protein